MRKNFLALLPLATALLVSCSSNRFEENNIRDAFFDWGVANNTTLFGEYDSLYYLINPIGNVSDSMYYNGNYTDSYYHADSLRVSMAYTTDDSVKFYIDRMYAVQTNPPYLLLTVFTQGDTTNFQSKMRLDKVANDGNLFVCKAAPDFRRMLETEGLLYFSATNCSSASEPQGSQNYEFRLNSIGFMQALSQAIALNPSPEIPMADSVVKDSLPEDTLHKEPVTTDKATDIHHKKP